MKKVFLLGGADLEMQTISHILRGRDDVIVCDRHLSWGARLSEYSRELKEYADPAKYEIYGIELFDNVAAKPPNYHVIDHHGERVAQPSSLEQVAAIMRHALSHSERLIAANDCGYIPAMVDAGACQEEIDEITLADRRAQGVTPEEEELCREAVRNQEVINGVTVVKSPVSRFSPITALLYDHLPLLIYTDTELTYYSTASDIAALAESYRKEIAAGKMYNGKGYIGIAKAETSEINEFINKVTNR